jgi:hypothetical protein
LKTLSPILLLLLFQIVTAQSGSLNTSPSDVTVLEHKLGSIVRVGVYQRDPPATLDNRSNRESNPPRDEWRVKTELTVQNVGSRRIKSIEWGLLLIVPGNPTTVRGYTAHSRKSIKPGETVTLASWITDDSLKVVSKQRQSGLLKEKAQITRIEYADGAIWKGEASLKVP